MEKGPPKSSGNSKSPINNDLITSDQFNYSTLKLNLTTPGVLVPSRRCSNCQNIYVYYYNESDYD